MAQLAAKKYATALFELFREQSGENNIYEEAKTVLSVLINENTLKETLLHPRVTAEQKIEIVHSVFKDAGSVIMGFLDIVIRKNREKELAHMLSMFLEMAEEHMGLINARVYTAAPLTALQLDEIEQKLSEKTNKSVNIEIKEDKSLIGGLRIVAGGFVYDTSVKKQLADLRHSLLSRYGSTHTG